MFILITDIDESSFVIYLILLYPEREDFSVILSQSKNFYFLAKIYFKDYYIVRICFPEAVFQMLCKKIEKDFCELLSCLSEKDRQLFYRKYILGETVGEIAAREGKNTQSVYTRLSRGRRRLKSRLSKNSGGTM